MVGSLILLFVAAVSAVPVIQNEKVEEYSELYPNKYPNGDHPLYGKNQKWYQGDMRFPGDEDVKDPKAMAIGNHLKWPNNVVPYYIDPAFAQWERNVITNALSTMEWNVNFCVRFVPWTWESDFVWIIPNGGGCWSFVGRIGGAQQLSLDAGCVHHGVVMHEFLHALGVYHEHQRGDQGSFVSINYNNIQPEFHYAFWPYTTGVTVNHLGTPYDYGSIMHYDAFAFAINPSIPTITPFQNVFIGQIDHMSFWDSQRIMIHYGCGKMSSEKEWRKLISQSPVNAVEDVRV